VARTTVVAGTATAVSGRVARKQQSKYAAEEQAQAPMQQPAPAQAAPAEADVSAEIVKLAGLRDQGVLTEEEFSAKKAQLLGI
jgi:hypothetical protein